MGNNTMKLAVKLTYVTHRGPGKFHRICDQGVQHRLDIRRRAGDNTQNFTGRGLLFQRFRKRGYAPSSLNSRTFSMAMTAWSAKVSRSLICAGVKGRTSVRRAASAPMKSPCWRRGAAR